jgi:hypothetical protein
MKKVIIKNPLGVQTHRAEMEEPAAWIAECVASCAWGKPERWVLHKDEAALIESYDEADVLEEEMRDTLDGVAQKWVKLKAEYTVEMVDLDQDPSWLLEQCHERRKAEYPAIGDFADAFVKLQGGDPLPMEQYVAACVAVKAKYPKPEGV